MPETFEPTEGSPKGCNKIPCPEQGVIAVRVVHACTRAQIPSVTVTLTLHEDESVIERSVRFAGEMLEYEEIELAAEKYDLTVHKEGWTACYSAIVVVADGKFTPVEMEMTPDVWARPVFEEVRPILHYPGFNVHSFFAGTDSMDSIEKKIGCLDAIVSSVHEVEPQRARRLDVLLSTEWLFFGYGGETDGRAITLVSFLRTLEKLMALSAKHPGVLLAPGTILWYIDAQGPEDKAPLKYALNTLPVVCDGRLVHLYHKRINSHDVDHSEEERGWRFLTSTLHLDVPKKPKPKVIEGYNSNIFSFKNLICGAEVCADHSGRQGMIDYVSQRPGGMGIDMLLFTSCGSQYVTSSPFTRTNGLYLHVDHSDQGMVTCCSLKPMGGVAPIDAESRVAFRKILAEPDELTIREVRQRVGEKLKVDEVELNARRQMLASLRELKYNVLEETETWMLAPEQPIEEVLSYYLMVLESDEDTREALIQSFGERFTLDSKTEGWMRSQDQTIEEVMNYHNEAMAKDGAPPWPHDARGAVAAIQPAKAVLNIHVATLALQSLTLLEEQVVDENLQKLEGRQRHKLPSGPDSFFLALYCEESGPPEKWENIAATSKQVRKRFAGEAKALAARLSETTAEEELSEIKIGFDTLPDFLMRLKLRYAFRDPEEILCFLNCLRRPGCWHEFIPQFVSSCLKRDILLVQDLQTAPVELITWDFSARGPTAPMSPIILVSTSAQVHFDWTTK